MISKILKWSLATISFLFLIEFMSYFPELYWGDQYFSPLTVSQHTEEPKVRPTTLIGGVGNSLIAKPFKVLVLGDSVLEGKLVPYEKQWLTLLENRLGVIQIENFAIGWTTPGAIKIKLNELIEKGKTYDLVIIQSNFAKKFNPVTFRNHHYSYRWTTSCKTFLNSICMFEKWFKRMVSKEIFFWKRIDLHNFFNRSVITKDEEKKTEPDYSRQLLQLAEVQSVWDNEFRHSEFVKERLTDQAKPISKKTVNRIRANTKEIVSLAYKLSDNLVWVPTRSFYSQKINEAQNKKRTYVYVDRREPGRPYLSGLGLSRYFDLRNEVVTQTLRELSPNVIVFDFVKELEPFLKDEKIYFHDDLHLAEEGHKAVFHMALQRFGFLFKTQNK